MKVRMLTRTGLRCGFAAAVLLSAVQLAGCGTKAAPPGAPVFPPVAVTTAMVETRRVPIYIDQIGKCVSPETVSVRAQASGQIIKVNFSEGADVSVGRVLFLIDPAPYQAALAQAKADRELNEAAVMQSNAVVEQYRAQLEEAKADLQQNETRQALNVREEKRAKGLEGVIAQQDYDAKKMAMDAGDAQIRSNRAVIARVQTQITQSIAAIDVAKARVKSSDAAILQAEINLAYTVIKSPIDGRAGQRMVDVGNVVTAAGNTTQTLLTIQSIDPIYSEFNIPETELARVQGSMKAGTLKVECAIPERADAKREGEVFFIDNAVQEGTGTIKLRARVANKDRMFWPGQFIKVRLIYEMRDNAALVPSEAPQLGQTGPFVFVVKPDSTVEQRPVKLGLRYGDVIAIDDGVKGGEAVVLKGQLMLQPGAKVSVQNETKKDGELAKPEEKK